MLWSSQRSGMRVAFRLANDRRLWPGLPKRVGAGLWRGCIGRLRNVLARKRPARDWLSWPLSNRGLACQRSLLLIARNVTDEERPVVVTRRAAPSRQLLTQLEQAAVPLFALDRRRRLMLFSAGMEALTGWTAGDVLGLAVTGGSGDDPQLMATVLAACGPPDEVWGGARAATIAAMPVGRTRLEPRRIEFVPLQVAQEPAWVLGLVGTEAANDDQAAGSGAAGSHDGIPVDWHAALVRLRCEVAERYRLRGVIGRVPVMERVLRQVALASRVTVPVLITGPAGVGKRHLARVIHYEGPAADRVLVSLDCEALPAEELRGAFRQAWDSRGEPWPLGTGTILLENADCLPRDLQELLARLINRAATNDGPPAPPVRVLATCRRDWQGLLASEALRPDYAHLLATFEIAVPSLAERRSDVPLLAQAFLESANRGREVPVAGFSASVQQLLEQSRWQGEVAELAAVVRAATLRCPCGLIEPEHLPFEFHAAQDAQRSGPTVSLAVQPLKDVLEQVERDYLAAVMERARGNKSTAAGWLGLSRPALYRRLEQLGLDAPPASTESDEQQAEMHDPVGDPPAVDDDLPPDE